MNCADLVPINKCAKNQLVFFYNISINGGKLHKKK